MCEATESLPLFSGMAELKLPWMALYAVFGAPLLVAAPSTELP